MKELINLKDPMIQSVQNGDQEKTQNLTEQLQDLWPQIRNISEGDSDDVHHLYELRNLTAQLLFIAKYNIGTYY